MGKEIKFKRLMIDSKITLIKVDVMIGEAVYVERDKKKKLVNFYFPKDDVSKDYVLGVAMPMDLLDGYVAKKVEQNMENVTKEILEKVKEQSDVKIG